MFTGASNAHVAILLVDARAGVLRQTRRHARIAKLLGIKHFVATVNKIDLVDFDQDRFAEVEAELQQMAARLGGAELTVIPIAAKHGDNVVHRSERHPVVRRARRCWNTWRASSFRRRSPRPRKLRLPVQWVSRPTAEQRRRYTGRLAAGTLRVGDPVVSLPAGTRSTVTALDTLDDDRDDRRGAAVGVHRTRRRHRRRPWRRVRQRAPTTPCCRCWRANSTRRCAGSPTPRCGPATGSRSSRAPARSGPPCRRCTPGWIPRRSTTSTARSSWRSTTSAR